MSDAVHISVARKMLDSGKPVSLVYLKRSGAVITMDDVISLRCDFRSGTRTVKSLRSNEKRRIRDACIIGINDFEVYL